jgi:hypothetical protein
MVIVTTLEIVQEAIIEQLRRLFSVIFTLHLIDNILEHAITKRLSRKFNGLGSNIIKCESIDAAWSA